MKLSQLIKALQEAKKSFGDIPAVIMNDETGDCYPVRQVLKMHPYTGPHSCMDRNAPVSNIQLSRHGKNADDLVLAQFTPPN